MFIVRFWFNSAEGSLEREAKSITTSTSFSMPYASVNMTTTFTAISENDIILFDFTTDSTSAVIQKIYSISIEEKQEFLVPLYAEDMWGNNHQVLRRNLGNTISDS